MKILFKKDLIQNLNYESMLKTQEEGFTKHSQGELTQPPVGLLKFDSGSLHIKYAHLKGDPFCVIKLVTSFSGIGKDKKGKTDGCYTVFSSETGELTHSLFDEGYLTNLRTVLAPSVILKRVFKNPPQKVGILGNGIIAKEQAKILDKCFGIKKYFFAGRRKEALLELKNELEKEGLEIETCLYSEETYKALADECSFIITTTSAREPVLKSASYFKRNAIVALGSDEPGKRELSQSFLDQADLLVCDSKQQSFEDGEFEFLKEKQKKSVFELDQILEKKEKDLEAFPLKVFDLTGMGVQDVQIAKNLAIIQT